jgi:hypothetical protein
MPRQAPNRAASDPWPLPRLRHAPRFRRRPPEWSLLFMTIGPFRGPDRLNPRLRWATRSMLATDILKFDASGAIPTKPSPSTSCAGQRRHPFTNWNGICAARIARRFAVTRISAATWWRCGQRRFRRAIRPRLGGRGNDEVIG